MKAPFLFLFICYANGYEDGKSYLFPNEDDIMIPHYNNNPRLAGLAVSRRDGPAGTMDNRDENLEIQRSGKLINQKLLSWLVTTTTLAPKLRNYTVFPTVMMGIMGDGNSAVPASPYFPSGYHVASLPQPDGKMLPDPLVRRRRFRRAPSQQKISAKSEDSEAMEDSNEPAKKKSLRSGGRSNERNKKRQGAFYHASEFGGLDDKDDDEPTKNDRDDRHSSEINKKNDKKSSESFKNYDRHDERSSENNDRDDKYGKKSESLRSVESGEREREHKKGRKNDNDRKSKKGSFKPGGSIEYEKDDKLEKHYKKESNEKYSKGKKSGYLSDRKESEETPRGKNEKARDLEPKMKSHVRDLETVRSRDRGGDDDADEPTRSRDDRESREEKKRKKHKKKSKKHHKKGKSGKKTGRKSNRMKNPVRKTNTNNGMGWPKLIDDASYENFRRHYYSNPRRNKREIYGFESGKPYKIGETRRLIAGTTARIEDFPYMASIQKYGEHWCSGAILNQRVIITTANCVWRSVDLSRMKVRVGSRHAHDGGQIADIQEVAKHPGWSLRQRNPDFDLALLLTSRPFKFSDTVHSVDLPNKNMYPAFDDAFIASFGAERRDGVVDDLNPVLQSYRADMIPRDECNKITKRFNVDVSENFICFAQRGKRAPCTRDTGAPAVSDGVVWGLASWSIRKKCGTERYPAVFSYTASIDNIHFLINATLKLMTEKRLPTYYDRLGDVDPQGNRHVIG